MEGLSVRKVNNYLIVILAVFLIASFVFRNNTQLNLFTTEWVVILLPALWFTRKNVGSIRQPLRLNPISIKTALFAVAIGASGWLVSNTFEGLISVFISKAGLKNPPSPIESLPGSLLLWLFLVSVSAGICEEVLFRGLILRGYEEWGTSRAIIFSAMLFALMHFSMARAVPIFLLGIIFAYMTVSFNSIFPSMIAHATNNGLSILALAFVQHFKDTNTIAIGALGMLMVLLAMVSFIALPFLLMYLSKKTLTKYIPAPLSWGTNLKKLLSMWSFDGFIFITFLFILSEVLYMTGLLQKLTAMVGLSS